MRLTVVALRNLGPFPPEGVASLDQMREHERLYRAIDRPVTNEEASALVRLFGPDDYFGLAASLMHLIETAPYWPIEECLRDISNPWVNELRTRAVRGGLL